jgi:hypothetical protein
LCFVQFRCLTDYIAYRDKKVVGVFVRFRAPASIMTNGWGGRCAICISGRSWAGSAGLELKTRFVPKVKIDETEIGLL